MKHIKIKELTMTSPEFPSQWEGITTDGKVIYIRYRFGRLQFRIARTIERAVALADDSHGLSKQVGAHMDGSLTQDEMLEHMRAFFCFKKCKFNKPKTVFYEFYSNKRPEEFEISSDRTRIHDWEYCKIFDENKFEEFSEKPESIFKLSDTARLEIAEFGWDKVMNKMDRVKE